MIGGELRITDGGMKLGLGQKNERKEKSLGHERDENEWVTDEKPLHGRQ